MTDYDKDAAQELLADHFGDTLQGLYKHYKGGLYIVFSTSLAEASGEMLVHYYSIENRTRWTRTIADFTSDVDGVPIAHGSVRGGPVPRFARIREALDDELRQAAFDNE